MKVDNKEFTRHYALKKVIEIFGKIAPDLVEILNHDIVRIDTVEPSYMNRNREVKVGGLDVTVQYDTVSYMGTGGKIKFGIRTDADGLMDMEKLAKKFKGNMNNIRSYIKIHESNMKTREEKRQKRISNGEILDKLKEEGVIQYLHEFDESSDGFETKIKLKNEEELRAFIAFRNELLAKREVTA